MAAVRVLVVDDHPVVRSGLRAMLSREPALDIVGEAGTGAEALRLVAELAPQVVLCDPRLGPGPDGVAITRACRSRPGRAGGGDLDHLRPRS